MATRAEIEATVSRLLLDIEMSRSKGAPCDTVGLFECIDPAVAANHIGFAYVPVQELERNPISGYETAGLLDRRERTIYVSERFKHRTQRFTGAHEVAHAVLHPEQVAHRDRPIHGREPVRNKKPRIEREADYFAGCLLVPEPLLRVAVSRNFSVIPPIRIDDRNAFALDPTEWEDLLRPEMDSFALYCAIASAKRFANRSLADQFGVSVSTMAIRLRETKLIHVS